MSQHDMMMHDMDSNTDSMPDEMMMMTSPFCGGMSDEHMHGMSGGMIMYMDGFRWSLKSGQSCLNLYFPGWTLDSKGKVVAAMIGVFVMAILVEGIAKMRHRIVRSAKQALRTSEPWNPLVLRATITLMHGLQALFGYILMLATMTFSLELLLCVVIGLASGYAIFFQVDEVISQNVSHVTTNPCCAFMEEEAREARETKKSGCCSGNNSGLDDNATQVVVDCPCGQPREQSSV